MEERIAEIVRKELAILGAGEVQFAVEWPADLDHGDYAVNAAMAASKALGKAPREIAEALAPSLREALGTDAASVEIAGPGFINITLSEGAISKILADAREEGWGRNTDEEGQRVMIEYSCPNPFKEMHIGHLMSTIIGESVARVIEYSGATVVRDSFGGDIGPHVAKAIWALREKGITEPSTAREISEAYEHGSRAYGESERAHADIDALNVALYDALGKDELARNDEDRALVELWRKGRETALAAFRELYGLLDTKFDYYFFESEVTPVGIQIVKDAIAKGVFEESDGAVIYPGEKKGLHTLVFITSRGTPTYEAKDIGLAFYKEERIETDQIIIETGAEQVGHFKVFLAALAEIAPTVAAKMSHISHGLMTLTTGKMSSRLGNTIMAAGLLSDVIERAQEKNDDPLVAKAVAVGAVKYMILRQAAGGNIVFDPEKSLSLEGDSGPYLQYALVRARSILEKAEGKTGDEAPEKPYVLARRIARFPEIVRKAQAHRAPHVVTQYLTQLASEWNSFYANERIIGGENEAYKLGIVRAFVCTMENGLWVLGIPAPEKM